MALYEPSHCPDCGAEKIDRLRDMHEKFFVQCSSCGRSGPHEECGISAITAWNKLPRMSTIIAWQFQAAGLALENQRLTAENACLRKLVTAQDRLASCDYMTNFLVLVSAGRGLFDPKKSSKLAAQRVEYDLANADVEAARKAVEGK